MTKPLLSIVMPSYNHGKYVDECITAFLLQSEENFELVIIDDASNDDNVDRIASYDDSRIRLFRRIVNRGVTAGVNDGVRLSNANIVSLFATDDIPHPGFVATVLDCLEANPAALAAYFPLQVIKEDGSIIEQELGFPKANDRFAILKKSFLGNNHLPAPGATFRREALLDILAPEGVIQISDWMLNNRVLLAGEIALGARPVLSYRTTTNSLCRGTGASTREKLEMRTMMDDFLALNTIGQIVEVFGKDADGFRGLPDAHAPFVLGRLALNSFIYDKRCWGYQTIIDHVSKPDLRDSLIRFGKYDGKALMDLTPLS